jgi:hypothetical protein
VVSTSEKVSIGSMCRCDDDDDDAAAAAEW